MDGEDRRARDNSALGVSDHAGNRAGGHALRLDEGRSGDGNHRCRRHRAYKPQQLRTLHSHSPGNIYLERLFWTAKDFTVAFVTWEKKRGRRTSCPTASNPN